MKSLFKLLITSFGTIIILSSCGKQSPEGAGKELGLKECNCSKDIEGIENDFFLKRYTKVLDEIKSGVIKTRDDYYAATIAISNEYNELLNRSIDTVCYRELKELRERNELEFAKEEDRVTISNAAKSFRQQCIEENHKAESQSAVEREKVVKEVMSRGEKLQ